MPFSANIPPVLKVAAFYHWKDESGQVVVFMSGKCSTMAEKERVSSKSLVKFEVLTAVKTSMLFF
jgi:hypothetical protein